MRKPLKGKIISSRYFSLFTVAIGIGVALLGVRGYNNLCNNRTITNPAYVSHSYATGLSGHIEYTKYSDGSQDVKEYHGLGHRLFDSELHQDLNGDNKIDRIRRNGSELKMNKLNELLIREHDYVNNKQRFDEADEQLQMLDRKFP